MCQRLKGLSCTYIFKMLHACIFIYLYVWVSERHHQGISSIYTNLCVFIYICMFMCVVFAIFANLPYLIVMIIVIAVVAVNARCQEANRKNSMLFVFSKIFL